MDLKKEHEEYRKLFGDDEYIDKIIKHDKINRNGMKSPLNRKGVDKKVLNIFDNLLNTFSKNHYFYYIQQFPQNDSPSHLLFTNEFKALIQVRLCGGTHDAYLKNLINTYAVLIEIEALHSFERGMGEKLINLLKEVSKKANTPIYLYDNNLKDVNYYQNLGFVKTTSNGINDEPLLVYEP